MKTNQPTAVKSMLKLTVFAIALSFLSCSGSKDDPYKDILALIPQDQNATDYLKQSVEYFNDVNKALNQPADSSLGRSISPELAKLLYENFQQNRFLKEDSIRAITYNYSNVLKSLKKFGIIDFDKTQMTILFGRYPSKISDKHLTEIGVDINTYTELLANNLTCVLTYRFPGVTEKLFFFQSGSNPYDDAGCPCPPRCSFEPIN